MSTHFPSCKPSDIERVIKHLDFSCIRQRGSHCIYVRAKDNITLVIPRHNKDIKRGTLSNIVRSLGLTMEEFMRLL